MTLPAYLSTYLSEYAQYTCYFCHERWSTTTRLRSAPPSMPCACGQVMFRQPLPRRPRSERVDWWKREAC